MSYHTSQYENDENDCLTTFEPDSSDEDNWSDDEENEHIVFNLLNFPPLGNAIPSVQINHQKPSYVDMVLKW